MKKKKVEIYLDADGIREIEDVERRRVLYPNEHPHQSPTLHQVADAAIEQGIIERYVKTTRDALIPVLNELNHLELMLRRRVLPDAVHSEKLPYSELIKHLQNIPSILAELNQAVSDHGIRFSETMFRIQIHKGHKLINLDNLSEVQLKDILAAAEKVLEKHKET